jgi:uncharacterized protein YjbI with pentapeptide repeats
MKTLMILSMAMALLASPSWGYKQEDLDKLAAINTCQECDLAGADLHLAYLREANLEKAILTKANLAGADLRGAVLTGAVLRDAKIDFADFTKAKFCNTVMPDGQRIFKDC